YSAIRPSKRFRVDGVAATRISPRGGGQDSPDQGTMQQIWQSYTGTGTTRPELHWGAPHWLPPWLPQLATQPPSTWMESGGRHMVLFPGGTSRPDDVRYMRSSLTPSVALAMRRRW